MYIFIYFAIYFLQQFVKLKKNAKAQRRKVLIINRKHNVVMN